jgi:hypothetical protein
MWELRVNRYLDASNKRVMDYTWPSGTPNTDTIVGAMLDQELQINLTDEKGTLELKPKVCFGEVGDDVIIFDLQNLRRRPVARIWSWDTEKPNQVETSKKTGRSQVGRGLNQILGGLAAQVLCSQGKETILHGIKFNNTASVVGAHKIVNLAQPEMPYYPVVLLKSSVTKARQKLKKPRANDLPFLDFVTVLNAQTPSNQDNLEKYFSFLNEFANISINLVTTL